MDKAIELFNTKLVEGTLSAGNTLVTLNDPAFVIPSSTGKDIYTYKIYTSIPEVRPISFEVLNGNAKLTFGKQLADVDVAVEVHKRNA